MPKKNCPIFEIWIVNGASVVGLILTKNGPLWEVCKSKKLSFLGFDADSGRCQYYMITHNLKGAKNPKSHFGSSHGETNSFRQF